MRSTLGYASWHPRAHDTNIQHLHDETNILPIQKHLHASQVRQKSYTYTLRIYTTHNTSQRLMKPTTNNSRYTTNIPTDSCTVTTADIKANMRGIHTSIASQHLAARDKILRTHSPQVSNTEENLPGHTDTHHAVDSGFVEESLRRSSPAR